MTSGIRWEQSSRALKCWRSSIFRRPKSSAWRAISTAPQAACANCWQTSLAGVAEHRPTSEICKIRDVIAAASEAVLPTAEKQSVRIFNDVPGGIEMPLVRSRMERVFLNLITNALEAMPQGGEIRIGLKMAAKVLVDRSGRHGARNSSLDSRPVVRTVRYRRQGRRPGSGAGALPADRARARRRHVDGARRRRPFRNRPSPSPIFAGTRPTVGTRRASGLFPCSRPGINLTVRESFLREAAFMPRQKGANYD